MPRLIYPIGPILFFFWRSSHSPWPVPNRATDELQVAAAVTGQLTCKVMGGLRGFFFQRAESFVHNGLKRLAEMALRFLLKIVA